MKFDVEGARAAGYSDSEIADSLASKAKFDAKGARAAGFTDEQIIGRLTMGGEMPAPPHPQGFGARLEREIRDIPRQIGLTTRHGIEGATEGLGVFSEPIRQGLNLLPGVSIPTAAEGGRALADTLGLPKPHNATERVVGDASRFVAGAATLGGFAGRAAQGATGGTRAVLERFAAAPEQQAAGAAAAGGASGYVRETGGGPVAQVAAGVAGGLGGAAGVAGLERAYVGLNALIQRARQSGASGVDLNVRINNILSENGVALNQLPAQLRAELATEVRTALDAGRPVNPDVVRRLADYGVVGATPTRGTVTLDPVTITQERNLAKFGANSQHPALQELSRVQNANNAQLIGTLDDMAGGGASRLDAGTSAVGAVRARDARAAGIERRLYDRARNTEGREVPLDRDQFVLSAYRNLAAENKGAFLPEGVQRLLEQIRAGSIRMDGNEFAVPFNVDVVQNLKTTLAAASRGTADGNTRRAIAIVRDALENTPIRSRVATGSTAPATDAQLSALQQQGDDVSAEAMRAFDRARRFARGRRQWQESASGIQAAIDDIPPDRFVQDYIIGEGNQASYGDVARLVQTLRRDPAAMQDTRARLVGWLREQAIGRGKDSEVGNFSAPGFAKALDQLGEGKLRLFFTPEEVSRLRAVGRVAAYETFQPRGSAVNNSNTAGAGLAMLDRLASSTLLSRVPLGNTLREPAQNWSAQIRAGRSLDAANALAGPRPRPEQVPVNALLPLTMPFLLPQRDR